MSGLETKTMLEVYKQNKDPSQFFTRRFTPKFFSSESVEIDIVRTEEEVAIAIQDMSTGPRMSAAELFTNKKFIPPVYDEGVPLNVYDLLKREPGNNPFQSNDFQAVAMSRMLDGMVNAERRIRRAIELQASQVMQSATVSLTDSDGNVLFAIDYKPKATHFPTSGTAWDQVGDDKVGDIKALADVIRADGLAQPDMLTFGATAFLSFINDDSFKQPLDNRRFELGGVSPISRGDEATFQGIFWIGDYRFEMWTVNSRYKHPQTGTSTPFMDPAKVIVEVAAGRKDGAFGAIPLIIPPEQRLLPFLPERISSAAGGVDLFPNAWVSPNGKNFFASLAARPIMIPVAIDTYGCLTTGL